MPSLVRALFTSSPPSDCQRSASASFWLRQFDKPVAPSSDNTLPNTTTRGCFITVHTSTLAVSAIDESWRLREIGPESTTELTEGHQHDARRAGDRVPLPWQCGRDPDASRSTVRTWSDSLPSAHARGTSLSHFRRSGLAFDMAKVYEKRAAGALSAPPNVPRCAYLTPSAALICANAAGSSMVVRSPGSRPSASAWIERRNSLPERVFGNSVTRCTAPDGRWHRSLCPPSAQSPSCCVGRLRRVLSTTKATGICP